MPSANPKLEKQASTETTDPIRQCITLIEHKIRNLEKRKGRLESYRDLRKNGKELEPDQQVAVAKYDGVLQTLEMTRELYKQIVGIANDAAKLQKKLARKEALERTQQDITKVREVLLIQDIMLNMGLDNIRDDFLAGTKGAVKLTQDDLTLLDNVYVELTVKRESDPGDPSSFGQRLQKTAEHYVAIIEGKPREILGTTYVKIKEIVTAIDQSGYFEQTPAQELEAVAEPSAEAPAETAETTEAAETVAEEFITGDVHIPPPESMIPMANYSVAVAAVPVVAGTAAMPGAIPVVAPQAIAPHASAPVDPYYANVTGYVNPQTGQQAPQPTPRINDVIGTSNFFFLQESELDGPEVTGQQATIVPHIPPAVNAPIPTQTFTNQNFSGAPVQVPQQVIYQHPTEMSHIPGFANPNPPPPIPMPPSHQQQFSPQHPQTFQHQQQNQPIQQQQQQQPGFETQPEQDGKVAEEKVDQRQEESEATPETESQNEPVDWSQMTDNPPIDDWNADSQQSGQQDQQQSQQQAWGEQRSGFRGRGGRRGNSNGYNGRGRGGNGGYQNGRTGGGQGGSYYRNENNYQNGYQARNYNNEGNSNYNANFKRGGGGNRGGSRGERSGMDRGGRGTGGNQFRGQRGGNRGGGAYVQRGKAQQ